MESNYIKLPTINYNLYGGNNGLRLLLIPNNNATIISCGVYINVGSLDEKNEELGIAHFLEHMMFKGSKRYPGKELVNRLDILGASYNATTSYEYTEYEIHGLPEYHDELLTILLDMYFNPIIPENEVDNERKIIIQEYNMRYDNKYLLQYLNFIKLATNEKNKLYNRPIIGTKEIINEISINDLLNFRKEHYTQDKTMITISGNINIDHTLKYLQKLIRELTNETYVFTKIDYKPMKNNKNDDSLLFDNKQKIKLDDRLIYKYYDTEQTNILIGFPCWENFNENNYLISIISSILTDGMSGRLTKYLREDHGMSYSQDSYLDAYRKFGIFFITVGVDNDNIYKSLIIIIRTLIELYKTGIKEDELMKVKNFKLTNMMINFQKQMTYFSYFTETIVNNSKINTLDDIIDKFDKLTLEQINNVIKKIINPKQMIISIIGPKSPNKENIKKILNYFDRTIKKIK